jgi:hypothetical protein
MDGRYGAKQAREDDGKGRHFDNDMTHDMMYGLLLLPPARTHA